MLTFRGARFIVRIVNWITKHLPEKYWDNVGTRLLESSADVLAILVFYLLARTFIVFVIARASTPIAALELDPIRARRIRTLGKLGTSALLYVLGIICALMLLRAVGVDPVPLITAAGVAGLAVGFGAQKLVRDIISGFFILLENQFAVGEIVTIAAITGTVCDVGLRTTRIQDQQGKLYIFSNGDITTVCNHSRSDLTIPLEVNVAANTDLQMVADLLDQIGLELSQKYGLAHPYKSEGVTNFDAAKVTLRIVGQVPPSKQDAFLTELRETIFRRLQQEGIAIV
ncbi:MAG: mechanosensitive ion channel domain-containing protein [Armatimonadota bacterium]